VIYDAEAIFSEREALRRRVFGEPFSAEEYRSELEREMALTRGVGSIVAVSEREANAFLRETGGKCYVIGHRLTPAAGKTPFKRRRDLLFVGALNGSRRTAPNIDSLYWFIEEVMPILDEKLGPSYKLAVAGRIECPDIRSLASDRVVFVGVVDDLTALYDQCLIFIAPTRFAAGISLKVYEACAHGTPAVTTSLIASQLAFTHEREVLVADDPMEWAECCARLYQEGDLWNRVREAALESVAHECSGERFQASIRGLLSEIPRRRTSIVRRGSSARNGAAQIP
jgi:O-antigen biosynthesis protein